MKHVIIIGAGIAGLTAAHELLEQNYKITLIERNDIIGGMARTYQDKDSKICPYEYSWRGYGPYYQNVYNMMKRIPFNEKEVVFNKLVGLNDGAQTCDKKLPIQPNNQNLLLNFSYNDFVKVGYIFLSYLSSCEERNIDTYSKIGLRDTIHKLKLSKQTEDLIGKSIGPYLGFDYHNASLYDLLYFYEMASNNSSSQYMYNITTLPTNYAWFDPWVRFLKLKGLTLYLNTEVTEITLSENTITSITIKNKLDNNYNTLTADYYINCTGPEILKTLLKPYKLSKPISSYYNKISKVAENGRQIQMSVFYYINKKMYFEKATSCIYLPNTPWLLIVLPTGHIWGDKHMKEFCKPSIKEILSIGICEPYENGIFIKKPWSKCTRKEIEQETWYQLTHDSDFINAACIEDNTPINNIKIINFKMWDSYIYNNGKIDTYEPKWANNINTRQYRPDPISPITNLFIGGSYSNTSTGIYSMESATESGKLAAKAVCKADNVSENIFLYTKKKYGLFAPLRFIDSILYNHPYIFLIIMLILAMIIWHVYMDNTSIPIKSISKYINKFIKACKHI